MRATAAARGTTSNPPHHRYTIYNSKQYRYIINTGVPSIQVCHLQQQPIKVCHQYRYVVNTGTSSIWGRPSPQVYYTIYNSHQYRYVINTGMPSVQVCHLQQQPIQVRHQYRYAISTGTLSIQLLVFLNGTMLSVLHNSDSINECTQEISNKVKLHILGVWQNFHAYIS